MLGSSSKEVAQTRKKFNEDLESWEKLMATKEAEFKKNPVPLASQVSPSSSP